LGYNGLGGDMVHTDDAAYIYPVLFGTDNGGVSDNGYFAAYDQGIPGWTQRLIANDLLKSQWVPQRNSIGWDRHGKFGAALIEDVSGDLEYWESPDDGWQDAAGAWALTDDDASQNWTGCDINSKHGFIHGAAFAAPALRGFYLDLDAGAPNIVPYLIRNANDANFSCMIDRALLKWQSVVLRDDADQSLILSNCYNAGYQLNDINIVADYPLITCDQDNYIWLFYTSINSLYYRSYPSVWDSATPLGEPVAGTLSLIYSANQLDKNYHATWLPMDNTIHLVLVDMSVAPNATKLIYLRRTPNGWTSPITLLTIDSSPLGDKDWISWPQITVDPYGNIFIHYIFSDDWTISFAGDLRGLYLDSSLYYNYDAPGNWSGHTNIDGGVGDVEWVAASGHVPIPMFI